MFIWRVRKVKKKTRVQPFWTNVHSVSNKSLFFQSVFTRPSTVKIEKKVARYFLEKLLLLK